MTIPSRFDPFLAWLHNTATPYVHAYMHNATGTFVVEWKNTTWLSTHGNTTAGRWPIWRPQEPHFRMLRGDEASNDPTQAPWHTAHMKISLAQHQQAFLNGLSQGMHTLGATHANTNIGHRLSFFFERGALYAEMRMILLEEMLYIHSTTLSTTEDMEAVVRAIPRPSA